MRIAYIGCVEFSEYLLRAVAEIPEAEVVSITTRTESPENSDHYPLGDIADKMDVPWRDGFDADWVRAQNPDVVYCFGWPRLIPDPDSLAPLGTVGYHPTLLPQGRGRHPIIWALAMGLRETGSTFFRMDERADAGPILSQDIVDIADYDDARTLYDSLSEAARVQVVSLTKMLAAGIELGKPQDDVKATYWRKRTDLDGLIKWAEPAVGIDNLIRALSDPYLGADATRSDLQKFKVWSCRLHSAQNLDDAAGTPGQVLAEDYDELLVQCGKGSIWIRLNDAASRIEVGKVGEVLL